MDDISVDELTQQMVGTIRDAISKMTAAERRAFGSKVCWEYLCGDARLTETVSGGANGRGAIRETDRPGSHPGAGGDQVTD